MPGIYNKDKFDLAGFSVGIVSKKKFLNKNDLKQIEFAKKETKPIYNNNSFMYEFLTSFRDKINAPFKKKDK